MNSMKPIFTSALTYGRNIGSVSSLVLVSLWMILAAGCATLRPDFVTPSVNVTSFKPLSSETFTPRFEIGMRVVNPNSSALNLRGMSYKLYLNDFEVVEGAANGLPEVPAYGEAEFKIIATVGLIEGVHFVNDLLQNARSKVDYRLQARLDVGAMVPVIPIVKSGSFSP